MCSVHRNLSRSLHGSQEFMSGHGLGVERRRTSALLLAIPGLRVYERMLLHANNEERAF